MKAYIVRDRLSDGSHAYNVRLEDGEQVMDIPCTSQKDAGKLLEHMRYETVCEIADSGVGS